MRPAPECVAGVSDVLINNNAVRGRRSRIFLRGAAELARKGHTTVMTDWWHEIDDAIVSCFFDESSLTPVEIGRKLGMSTEAVTSLLGRLAQEGKIAILRVALATRASGGGADR
jgi:hypothetical protein